MMRRRRLEDRRFHARCRPQRAPDRGPRGGAARPRSGGRGGRLLLGLTGLATAVFVLVAPAGAQIFSAPELTCGRTYDLVKSLLKRHVSYRQLSPELRERAIEVYLESIDPSKTLFLSGEIQELRRRLKGVFFGMQNDECELLDELRTELTSRYARMEEEVRAFVSDEAYALDPDVVLILDPEKRGHPQDDAARRNLVERLVHFQMSNYLESD
ncbi:MAG TPA: hypothetical protein VKA74_09975, partial [Myxococcota bacterium]|nr:hypothetical protein [Myxococcota bacterium]